MKKLLAPLIVFFFASPLYAQDVELSWDRSLIYSPGAFLSKSPQNLTLDKTYPAIIYLHGCTGINGAHDVSWAKFLAAENYVVVMPDSMARPNRKSNCDPRQKGGTNIFPQAYEYRQQEIAYAKEQIQKSSWWDQKNLFLMGHSEGGIATAQSDHGGFNGLVISGWTCTHKNNPSFDGIKSPKDIPALAVAFVDDAWRKGKFNEGRCADKADGRALVQVDLQGLEHGTYESRIAREAVAKFLKDHSKP
jgi:dienelactone hydrolase